jgi:hypothetical protein
VQTAGGRRTRLVLRADLLRRSRRRWIVALIAIVGGSSIAVAVVASQRGPLPKIAVQRPVATTLSWFSAVNAQNKGLALAHFVPADREMMEWSSWGPPFTHLRCSLQSGSASAAVVSCTFADINDPDAGMSNVSSWSVYLQRESSGRWLINNYGQG